MSMALQEIFHSRASACTKKVLFVKYKNLLKNKTQYFLMTTNINNKTLSKIELTKHM